MGKRWNDLQWNGEPGHYEVYYLTFTDPASRIGFWIRYTMVAPLPETAEEATCSLWFCAMDPANPSANVGAKASFPAEQLSARRDPFPRRSPSGWMETGENRHLCALCSPGYASSFIRRFG